MNNPTTSDVQTTKLERVERSNFTFTPPPRVCGLFASTQIHPQDKCTSFFVYDIGR